MVTVGKEPYSGRSTEAWLSRRRYWSECIASVCRRNTGFLSTRSSTAACARTDVSDGPLVMCASTAVGNSGELGSDGPVLGRSR